MRYVHADIINETASLWSKDLETMEVGASCGQKDMKILSMRSNVSDPAHIAVFYSIKKA